MYRMQRYTFSVIVSVNLAFLIAYLAVLNWSYDGNSLTATLHREYTEGLVEHVEEAKLNHCQQVEHNKPYTRNGGGALK